VTLNNGFTDVQAQAKTRAGAPLGLDTRNAIEALPDAPLLGERQARPLITYRDASLACFTLN
jgi:hypothetical protein